MIYSGAFYGTALTDIDLPAGLLTIENSVFYGCADLTEIIIPDSVTTLGEDAFRNSGLVRAVIGNGITRIEDNTFRKDDDSKRNQIIIMIHRYVDYMN